MSVKDTQNYRDHEAFIHECGKEIDALMRGLRINDTLDALIQPRINALAARVYDSRKILEMLDAWEKEKGE